MNCDQIKKKIFVYVCCGVMILAANPMMQGVQSPLAEESAQHISQRQWRVALLAFGMVTACVAGAWVWHLVRGRATRFGSIPEHSVTEEDLLVPQVNQLCANELDARESIIFEQELARGHCDPDGLCASGIAGQEYRERRDARRRESRRLFREDQECRQQKWDARCREIEFEIRARKFREQQEREDEERSRQQRALYDKRFRQLVAQEEQLRGMVDALPDTIVCQEAAERAERLDTYYQEYIAPFVPACRVAERRRQWAVLPPEERRARCFMQAVERCDIDRVKKLLTCGVDVRMRSKEEHITPLFVVARKGCVDLVKLFLAHGADVNCVTRGECITPVYVASEEGHAEAVYELLCAGADPRIASRTLGFSPLHAAVLNKHSLLIELLCRYKPSLLDIADVNGATPLHHAVYNEYENIVDLLCQAGRYLK